MKDYIFKNFLSIIVLVLLALLLIKSCDKFTPTQPTRTVQKDTVLMIKEGTNITTKPTIINKFYDTASNSILIPSDSLAIKKYILELRKELLSKIAYNDTLKIDSIGYVNVKDTIQGNKILDRKYSYNLKYPKITTTITIKEPYKPTRQLYVGGEMFGNKTSLIQAVNAGVLYKTRVDNIYSLKLGVQGINGNLQPNVGVGLYWKLKLKK